jgi:hypothetical protein
MWKLLQLIGKCKICQSYQGPVIHMGLIATICHNSCLPTIFLCKFHCHKLYTHLTSSFTIAFCSMSFWGACHNTWEEEERCCTFGSLTVYNGQVTMPRRQRSTPHPEAGWPESKCERFVSSNLVNLSAIQHFHEILCWKQEQRHPCLIASQSLQNFQAPVWELMYHVFSQLQIPISSARAE